MPRSGTSQLCALNARSTAFRETLPVTIYGAIEWFSHLGMTPYYPVKKACQFWSMLWTAAAQ